MIVTLKNFLNANRIAVQNFMVRYENIYRWDLASKSQFIAMMSALTPVFVAFAWLMLYLFDIESGGLSKPELLEGIFVCVCVSGLMLFNAALAHFCLYREKLHQSLLFFTLISLALSQSIVFSVIGLFDGLSWLLFFIYAAIGFVLLPQRHVFATCVLVMAMMIVMMAMMITTTTTMMNYGSVPKELKPDDHDDHDTR